MSRQNSIFKSTSILREIFILVSGILIAFGLDAWWDNRIERAEVQTELSNILSELQINRNLVDQYVNYHIRTEQACKSFLDILENSNSRISLIPDSVIWGVGFTPSFDPRTGAIEALINSGKLSLITSPQLRNVLASLGGILADARDEEMRARDQYDLLLAKVLYQSGDITRTMLVGRDKVWSEHDPILYTPIEQSTELSNHLARRHLYTLLSIESLKKVHDEISAIIELIEESTSH